MNYLKHCKRDSLKILKNKQYLIREQLTYVKRNPSDGVLKVIDAIIKTYFDNLKYVRDVAFDDAIVTCPYFSYVKACFVADEEISQFNMRMCYCK